MKTNVLIQIAIWLVERASSDSAGEAFAGDLLENFARGRSAWWCLGEALFRVAYSLEQRLRALVMPLLYCIAFVCLHPLWQRLCAPSTDSLLARYRDITVWPGSAVLEIASGLLPAVLFVSSGTFVYLILNRHTLRSTDPIRIMLSLSLAWCLLSGETILRLGTTQKDLRILSRYDFFYPFSHVRFSMMLLLSLFAAIATLPARRGTTSRYRGARWIFGRPGVIRALRGLGFTAFLTQQLFAQPAKPQAAAAKRLVQLIESFDADDWDTFHTAYLSSFISAPPDVPLGRKFFRKRTGGLDLREVYLLFSQ